MKKPWNVHPIGAPGIDLTKTKRIVIDIAGEPPMFVADPDGFRRLVSKDSCDGCKHLHFVKASEFGTSHNGWGCLMSGGHAIKRCSNYESEKADADG